MKSSKYEYRVETTASGGFKVAFRPLHKESDSMTLPVRYDTIDEAMAFVEKCVADDDWKPELVACW